MQEIGSRDAARFGKVRTRGSTLRPLHWDFVCDILSEQAAGALSRANRRALRAVNRPGSAIAALA
jgi:hypothetical protein